MINFIIKKNILLILLDKSLFKLPTPVNVSIWWNFGRLLGLFLIVQLISGLFLSIHYVSNINYSFFRIIHIIQDVNYGWLIRLIHMNGASFFFFCVYFHIGRGLYYGSYKLIHTWFIGIIIFLIIIGTAFIGYVLPWGQISFWGATVITNLLSAIPYIGQIIVEWLWGGFSVDNSTLNRFYTFHFLIPFILIILVLIHLVFLHETGSNNPLGLNRNLYKISFHNYYTLKDLLGFIILIILLIFIVIEFPYILGDPENFVIANSIVTPVHIQPEWYFLFAYTILRSIPDKLSGVLALLISILILYLIPILNKNNKFQGYFFYPFNQILFWFFICVFLILTWLGSQPVDYPYVELSQILTILYFLYYFLRKIFINIWDFNIKF